MKKLFVILMVVFATFALADVNVTYVVNMSTLTGMGATDSTYEVQLCGSEVGPEGTDNWYNIFLTWGDDSQMATNFGGDYWHLTVAYPDSMIGWRMAYKIRYKSLEDEGFNWENVTIAGGNRMYVLSAVDTVLQPAYVNNNWDPPYTPSDSVDIFFRINMGADEGFIDTDPLCMVGGLPAGGAGTNMWSPGTYVLEQEGSSDFWNYHLKLDPSLLPLADQMYRYLNGTEWSDHNENLQGAYFPGNENRGISLGTNDTTIAWVWWNDIPGGDFEGSDSATITFGVDMSSAVENNGFEIGDTLEVRLGFELSSTEVLEVQMVHVGGTQMYSIVVNDVPLVFGDYLYYQYYMVKNGADQREVYYNFNYDGDTQSAAERRRIIISGASATVADIESDLGDDRRMPFFRNNSLLAQDVTVHVECDLRPAFATVAAGKVLEDIQGSLDISNISDITGVAINGPLSNNVEGTWAGWGSSLMADTTRKMWDDGTHGDATAGDTIYTITYFLSPDSSHTVGQECKFGIKGGDNEGGEGGYGNNHIVNIDDSQAESYLYIAFGSINPAFYSEWTPVPGVGVEDVVPATFELVQNYPNPFNPITTIGYQLPASSDVKLSVFDMTGRKIRTLVDGYVAAGIYEVKFDASNLASGVYFYQLTSNNNIVVKKMVLMK
ncbi:MAG: T9SS type A sorting domain-containing protein [Candidatus Marinimicrobia bacterium]|nr:T9SS type A sorting domain-containing protein [Candidatus Neomarinimicrobiota bacterium]